MHPVSAMPPLMSWAMTLVTYGSFATWVLFTCASRASGTNRPDFIVCAGGHVWVEDVKGVETQAFKLKRKLWEQRYPWMELRVIGGGK